MTTEDPTTLCAYCGTENARERTDGKLSSIRADLRKMLKEY